MKRKLRIYCILADENLFHPHYFNGIIKGLSKKGYKVVGLTLALDKYKRGFANAVFEQIYLWGLLPFAFIATNSLVRTGLFRLGLLRHKTVRGVALLHNIPVYETFNVNDKTHLSYLSKKNIDIIISSNGQIFKKDLLKLPKVAAINRHSALLPSYGGVLPIFWAMKKKEKKLGTSVHYMVEKIDKGDILAQYSFENEKGSSLFENYMYAFNLSIPATIDAIENILNKKTIKKFRHNKNEYFSFPERKMIKMFKKTNKPFRLKDVMKFYTIY